MKVRISYGVELDNVPQELEQLFMFVSDKSHTVSKQVKQIHEFLYDEDVESAINLIERLRLSLAEIDNRVADVSNIATGYINYKQNEGVEDVEQGRPSVDTAEERPSDRNTKQSTGNPHTAGT